MASVLNGAQTLEIETFSVFRFFKVLSLYLQAFDTIHCNCSHESIKSIYDLLDLPKLKREKPLCILLFDVVLLTTY